MNSQPVPGPLLGSVGSFLEDARRGALPDGWLYRPKTDDVGLDTPCMTDPDPPRDDRFIPLVAMEHGYEVESLDSHAIENVVAWARLFRDPPDPPLMLEGFVYYCRYDAFPPAPGAGPPPPWEEVQRRLDREFYDGLGAERSQPRCQLGGCGRGAIVHSVMCRVHHFEMVKKRPSPFDDREMSAVRITITDLWTYAVSDSGGTARQPLSNLGAPRNQGHVHGRLTITVADRAVPHLGYFGPDDVCLNAWIVELCRAVNVLAHSPSEYVFDEGEQGQPAFKFERGGPEVAFSIVESAFSGGSADAEWQGVRFSYDEFRAAVTAFLGELRRQLRAQAPLEGDRWWPKDPSVGMLTP